jgi:TonB-linked SusC/RagA family outer membrane protein
VTFTVRTLAILSVLVMAHGHAAAQGTAQLAAASPEPLGLERALPRELVGTIQGRVTDAGSGRPLLSVQVAVVGQRIGALSNQDGRFLILNVPAGQHNVSATLIGYQTTEATVTVVDGQAATIDFRLESVALRMDEIVVTGTAGRQTRREIGNVVGSIDGAGLREVAPIATTSDLLRGREAGVAINLGQGSPGTASVIRIRGQGSLAGTNQPIVFVDGVRVNDRMSAPQGAGTGTAISRIDDFSPHEIERVEVIKGPAAATLYGTEAASGVIQIFTKRGAYGQPAQWNATVRQGLNWFANPAERTPTNWGRNKAGEVVSWNPVAAEEARGTPMFTNGHVQEYAMDVSGGAERMRYFLSGTGVHADGVQPASWQKRYNFRTNVSATPTATFTMNANAGFVLSRVGVPGQQTQLDFYRSAQQGGPELLDTPRRGFRVAPPEVYHERTNLTQESERMTIGLSLNHEPTDWFTHRLNAGLDATDQRNTDYRPFLSPYAAQFFSARDARGLKDVRLESVLVSSFDYGATVDRTLTPSLSSNTSAGLQVNTKRVAFARARGEEFPSPGVAAVTGAARTLSEEDMIENNTVGVYVQQQFGWDNRLFLVGAVRADDNSAFGDEFSLVYYPKVSGSWVVTEGADGWLNSLRLRAAYGESGQQPDVYSALRTYLSRSQPDGKPAVYPSAPGNAALGPERGKEIEAGFDASLFTDRVRIGFTFYDKVMEDAILARDAAPSMGFTQRQYVNVGTITNQGIEASLAARLLDREALDWDLDFRMATNENMVEELGIEGFVQLGWTTRAQEGYPLGGYWGLKVLEADVDAAGKVTRMLCDDGKGGSINCREAPQVFAGGQDPKMDGSITSTFTLFNEVRVHAMSDFKLGQHILNNMAWDRYTRYGVAYELWHRAEADPKVLASAEIGQFGDSHMWLSESSYWKLREIGVSAPIPASWSSRIGATRGTVSVAMQNIAMIWTNFSWYPEQDPEMNAPGRSTDPTTREPQMDAFVPPLTSLEMSIRLGF